MTSARNPHEPAERGVTLIELMIALVVLSIGVLALAQTFPAGSRKQASDRLFTTANQLLQDKTEELSTRNWADVDLDLGRHPAAGFDSLGPNRNLLRHYQVSAMANPLDNLRKVTVRVEWQYMGARACSTTIYVRR
jgi:prepilin-type N-terminal cleavage/methylation domain-containing protein